MNSVAARNIRGSDQSARAAAAAVTCDPFTRPGQAAAPQGLLSTMQMPLIGASFQPPHYHQESMSSPPSSSRYAAAGAVGGGERGLLQHRQHPAVSQQQPTRTYMQARAAGQVTWVDGGSRGGSAWQGFPISAIQQQQQQQQLSGYTADMAPQQQQQQQQHPGIQQPMYSTIAYQDAPAQHHMPGAAAGAMYGMQSLPQQQIQPAFRHGPPMVAGVYHSGMQQQQQQPSYPGSQQQQHYLGSQHPGSQQQQPPRYNMPGSIFEHPAAGDPAEASGGILGQLLLTAVSAKHLMEAVDLKLEGLELRSQREKAAFLSSLGLRISQQHYSTTLRQCKEGRWIGAEKASEALVRMQQVLNLACTPATHPQMLAKAKEIQASLQEQKETRKRKGEEEGSEGSEGDDDLLHSAKQAKRIPELARQAMHAYFRDVGRRPTKSAKLKFLEHDGITMKQINVFFQNLRARTKAYPSMPQSMPGGGMVL